MKVINRPVAKIADELGYAGNFLVEVMQGDRIPTFTLLEDIVLFLHVRPEWLYSVDHSMDDIDASGETEIAPESTVESTAESTESLKSLIFSDCRKVRSSRAEIADRINKLRISCKMEIKDFAAYTGFSYALINQVENQRKDIGEDSLKKIAARCDVGFYWLLSGDLRCKDNPYNNAMEQFLWNNEAVRKILWRYIWRIRKKQKEQKEQSSDNSFHGYERYEGLLNDLRELAATDNIQAMNQLPAVDKNKGCPGNRALERTPERTPDLKEMGKRIKEIRLRKGCSLRDFAELTDVSKSTLGLWEQGKVRPDPFTLRRICEALDIGTDWLLYGDEKRKKYPCDRRLIEFLEENEEVRRELKALMRRV